MAAAMVIPYPAALGWGLNLCCCSSPTCCNQILNPWCHDGNAKAVNLARGVGFPEVMARDIEELLEVCSKATSKKNLAVLQLLALDDSHRWVKWRKKALGKANETFELKN